jgi:hypothetical protein
MFVPVTGGVADLVVDKRDSVHPFRAEVVPIYERALPWQMTKAKQSVPS